CRNNSKFLLPLKDKSTVFVPTHLKVALEFVDPLPRRLQRSVRSTRRVVHKKRTVRRQGLLLQDPAAGVVRQIFVQGVIALTPARWNHTNRSRTGSQLWMPLVGFGAYETIEIIEALTSGPMIKRAGESRFRVGDQMPFADAGRSITVLAQNLRKEPR